MKKSIIYLLLITSLASSCEDYNEDIFEIVGTYDANIIGVPGAFDMVVASDFGDNILIKAPFDGAVIDVISADIDCEVCEFKEIDIDRQEVDRNVIIWGRGLYSYGTIQIDYEMEIDGAWFEFTMIGTRF